VLSRRALVLPIYLVSCVLYTDFLICLVWGYETHAYLGKVYTNFFG
jgi:hypothetical protein